MAILRFIHKLLVNIGRWLERREQLRHAKLLASAWRPEAWSNIIENAPSGEVTGPICEECGKQHPTLSHMFCNECGRALSEGPTGGIAVNMVCNYCRINFGCLGD